MSPRCREHPEYEWSRTPDNGCEICQRLWNYGKKDKVTDDEILKLGKARAKDIGLETVTGLSYYYFIDDVFRLLGSARRVFGYEELWSTNNDGDNNQALLIGIQPIEKEKPWRREKQLEDAIKKLLDATAHWVGLDPARINAQKLLERKD